MRDVAFAWGDGFSIAVDAFALAPRERVLLLGPSGGGKSTLLNLIAGIVAPQRGRIEVLGTDMNGLKRGHIDRFRAEHFGIVFQMFNLMPFLSPLDNAMLPLRFAPARRARAAPARAEAARLLTALGVETALHNGRAATLSVGQQQRVAAARALIGRPEIILADEPTSALDRPNAASFLDLLSAELSAADAALLMVSHDETLAGFFDRTIHLDEIARVMRRDAA